MPRIQEEMRQDAAALHAVYPVRIAPVSTLWLAGAASKRADPASPESRMATLSATQPLTTGRRLNAKCVYLADSINPNLGPNGAPVVILQPQLLSNDVLLRSSDPLQEISASQILSLIAMDAQGGEKLDWMDGVRGYFEYIHSWYAVVHQTMFEQQVAALIPSPAESPEMQQVYSPPLTCSPSEKSVSVSHTVLAMGAVSESQMSREFALLIVTMYMSTRHRATPAGERMMFDDLYRFVKRVVALSCLESTLPKLELVQCGALLALYEYGHGDSFAAYRTLSETAGAARVVGVTPGHESGGSGLMYGLASMEEEQKSGLWWALFILDQ